MTWRVARSLDVLLSQLNATFPARNKASDGSIGDANHQNRTSDHNPWYGPGIVTARDYTHDPAHGVDMARLTDELQASRDPRIKYVIFNRWIMDTRPQYNPWKWVRYKGANPHTTHMHLSVMPSPSCDSPATWALPTLVGVPAPLPITNRPVLRTGSAGDAVRELQAFLNRVYPAYSKLVVDGQYGPKTAAVVAEFQRRAGLDPDGVVGPRTWVALGFK